MRVKSKGPVSDSDKPKLPELHLMADTEEGEELLGALDTALRFGGTIRITHKRESKGRYVSFVVGGGNR